MQALVLERKGELSLREIDLPLVVGPTDVKVAINTVGVCGSDVPPAVPEVTEYGDSADVDVDVLWHVDIDVPEDEQQAHGSMRLVQHRVAQVKVQIAKGSRAQSPPA